MFGKFTSIYSDASSEYSELTYEHLVVIFLF